MNKKGKYAMTDQKEKFLNAPPAPAASSKEDAKPPLYLLALIFIFGVLLTAAFFIYTDKNKNDNPPVIVDQNTQNDINYKTVPITMLHTKDCQNCLETNTIEAVFQVRQIPYTIAKVDADSTQGKELLDKYRIATLPTAIIDAEKLKYFPTTVSSFEKDTRIKRVGTSYVVPELNLYPDRYYPLYYTDKVEGMCADRPSVTIFDDFYTPQNSYGRRKLYDFTMDFNKDTDIKFVYTQTRYSADRNSQMANLFLMCASVQGKYTELERTMAGIYCNNPFKGDPTILTDSEINGCWTLSNHYGTPLTEQELNVALGRTSIDINAFKECYKQDKVNYNNAKKTVEDLGIERTGTVLLDCRETTAIEKVHDAFCKIHPGLDGCAAKSNDTNST